MSLLSHPAIPISLLTLASLKENLCRSLQESSLAALIQHKTRMLAPFIKAARAAVKHEIRKENEPRYAHQPEVHMILKMIN